MSCNVPFCSKGWIKRGEHLHRCAACATGKRYPTVGDTVSLKCDGSTTGKITDRYQDRNFRVWATFTVGEASVEIPLLELKLVEG